MNNENVFTKIFEKRREEQEAVKRLFEALKRASEEAKKKQESEEDIETGDIQ